MNGMNDTDENIVLEKLNSNIIDLKEDIMYYINVYDIFKIVASNDIDGFERFVRNRGDINITDGLGRNLFMIAVIKGHSEMMDKIMSYHKIDLGDRDYDDNNALMIAVKKGNVEIVSKLFLLDLDTSIDL